MPKIFHDHHKNPLAPPPTYLMYSLLINNKTFENVSVIFDEPLALANEIMLNIMQSFKYDFLENEFWADWGVLSISISRNLLNFSTGFFSMYTSGIIELKNYNSILRKNGWFANKTCYSLTALFLKTRIYFCCCNFANKQINKNS